MNRIIGKVTARNGNLNLMNNDINREISMLPCGPYVVIPRKSTGAYIISTNNYERFLHSLMSLADNEQVDMIRRFYQANSFTIGELMDLKELASIPEAEGLFDDGEYYLICSSTDGDEIFIVEECSLYDRSNNTTT